LRYVFQFRELLEVDTLTGVGAGVVVAASIGIVEVWLEELAEGETGVTTVFGCGVVTGCVATIKIKLARMNTPTETTKCFVMG